MFATDESVSQATMANSARQTVLRRIAPALRHDMVVHLQALSMMAEMLNARLDRGQVAPADVQASVSKLNRLSREAVAGCLKVMGWIESPNDDSTPLHTGVEEIVRLLTASFNFRGFALVNEVAAGEFEVRRSTLRMLLVASLITLADTAATACEFVIESQPDGDDTVLTIRSRPREQASAAAIPPATDAVPRPTVDWPELEALAAIEHAAISRSQGSSIALRLPRACVTSPLQMAPV